MTALLNANIASNALTGPIDSGLYTLTNLVSLNVAHNQLSGTISSTVTQMTLLTYVACAHCRDASGVSVRTSSCGRCELEFAAVVHINSALDVDNNDLTGSLSTVLNALASLPLWYLDLSYNHFVGNVPLSVTQLTSLTYLDFGHNDLTIPTFPDFLSAVTSLRDLDLSGAGMTGTIPSTISTLTQLTNLDLSNNHLTGSIPTTVQAIPTLQYDTYVALLVCCGVAGNFLRTLVCLFLMYDLSRAVTADCHVCVWYALAPRRNVDLHNNQLSGSIPSGLSTATGLSSLNLNSNSLTGTVPSTISTLTALTLLNLGKNPLSGSFPSQLSTLTHLQYLDTSNAGYSGSVPSTITALQALTYG